MTLPTLLRFAARDLRGGLAGLRVLVACIALGVFAIAGVNALAGALTRTLASEGRTLLGGDVSFSRMNRAPNPDERAYFAAHGALTTVATLRAMARDQAGEAALVEVKAVPEGWPKLGAAELAPPLPVADALAKKEGQDGAAVEQALLDRLGAKLGDTITLGDAPFVIRAVLVSEPDRLALGVGFGPRVLIGSAALAASALSGDDALVRYTTRLALADPPPPAAALDVFLKETKAKFPDAAWETRTRDNVSPDFARNIDRFAEYLTLVGLFSLVVGGAGVAIAARGFVERKRETLAILKSLGARGSEAAGILIAEFLMVALLGIVIGLVLGEALPFVLAGALNALLPLPLEPALDLGAAGLAALYGFATALAFALPALGEAHAQKPMATFRGTADETAARAPLRYPLGAALALAVLAATATLSSPQRAVALTALGASVVSVVALWALGLGLKRLAPKLRFAGGFSWRYALANIARKGSPAPSVVMALGLGFGVLVALTLVDVNLRAQLKRVAAGETPSYYFLDVRAAEADAFLAFLKESQPTGKLVAVPMLRGRITKLNATNAEDIHAPDSAAWALEGDRGITFAEDAPANAAIIDGAWWAKDYAGPPLVSFEAEVGKGLGLKIGDSVEVNVLGRPVTARIANFRKVDWRSFAINFVMVFSPDAFKGAPYSDLVSLAFATPPANEGALVRQVAQKFPTIVSVPVREAIATIDRLVANLALAIRLASLLALGAAVFVLAAALAADRQARVREGAILKALGATRGLLFGAAAREYALLGAVSALVGAGLGALTAYAVVAFLFRFDFVFPLGPFAAALVAGPVLTAFLGLLGTWRALAVKPAETLRAL